MARAINAAAARSYWALAYNRWTLKTEQKSFPLGLESNQFHLQLHEAHDEGQCGYEVYLLGAVAPSSQLWQRSVVVHSFQGAWERESQENVVVDIQRLIFLKKTRPASQRKRETSEVPNATQK